ncbi:MAG: hypothetical protein KIT80_11840 [Chitinophagaceae bacterium]|nr:hypothetical protein [Chitinophagaceae bacterium]MCW5927593.1 hypothetical protein [Chitinophagaceae bacterium]
MVYLVALIFFVLAIYRRDVGNFDIINGKKPAPYWWIAAAFGIKVLAGFIYGYVYAHYLPNSDSWMLFRESLQEYDNLLHRPADFFSLEISFDNPADIFSNDHGATWRNTDDNLFIKILGLLNVFTGGNYYLTSLLFNFFSFFGLYQIFMVAARYYPKSSQPAFLLIFLMPSCLFWNSGLHKDGLIVFFTGILILATHRYISGKSVRGAISWMGISLVFLFLFRIMNAFVAIPAITAWILASKKTGRAYKPYLIVYFAGITFFFLTVFLPEAYNLPLKFAEKQHDFLREEGNSILPLTRLEANLPGYIEVLPQAVNHVFFRPGLSEISGLFQLVSFIEIWTVWLMILWFLYRQRFRVRELVNAPFLLFLLAFSVSILLVIGFAVPFTGSIVRYRSFYLMLFFLPFILKWRLIAK